MILKDYISDKNRLKIILSIQCILITIGIISVYFSYSGKYTSDIFSRLIPIIFIFDLVITVGFLSYIYFAKKSSSSINKFSKYLTIVAIFCLVSRLILIYVPYLGGISGWPGDTNTHGVYIYEIVNNGVFHINNHYPFTHIVNACLNLISGVPIIKTMNISIIAYLFVFFSGLYLLSQNILHNLNNYISTANKNFISNFIVIIACFGLIAFISTYTPHTLSLLFYPIIFAIILSFIRTGNINYYIILGILLIPLSLYHPAVCIYLFIIFLVYLCVSSFALWLENKNIQSCLFFLASYRKIFYFFIAMLIVFVFWVVVINTTFNQNISELFSQLLALQESTGNLDSMINKVDKSGLDMLEILKTGIKIYGFKVIIIFSSFLSFLYLYITKKKNMLYSPIIAGLFGITLFMVAVWFLSLIGFPGSDALALKRFEYSLLIFCPIIIGFAIISAYKKVSKNTLSKKIIRIFICTICFLIIVFGCISSFTSQPSPFTHQVSSCNVDADFESYHWLISYSSNDFSLINQPLTDVYRIMPIAYLLYDDIKTSSIYEFNKKLSHFPVIADHFGYSPNKHTLSLLIGSHVYIPIRNFDRLVYTEIYQHLGRITERDFHELETDDSVLKIYSNKGYSDIYITA